MYLDGAVALDPGASARVRIALLPVGATSAPRFQQHAAMLAAGRAIPLAALDRDMLPGASSPAFPCQAGKWENGELLLEWVDGTGLEENPWDAFLVHRGVLAVVGVCHCPENPDLMHAWEVFLSDVQSSPVCRGALSVHCLALDPLPEHTLLTGGPVGYTLHVVPREAGAKEEAIGEVLGTLGAELLRGLEQKVLQAESHPPQLLTPNDGGSDLDTQVINNLLRGCPCTLERPDGPASGFRGTNFKRKVFRSV